MTNTELRTAAKKAGLHLWQLADAFGCTDATFSRKLRHELPQAEKDRLFKIIDELKGRETA